MLFSNLILATLMGIGCALASPLGTNDGPPDFFDFFKPSKVGLYNTGTGSIAPAPAGVVSKFPGDRGQDTTTLLTFTYPPEVAGKKCFFAFYLDSTASVSGSGKIDLFSSLGPAPDFASGWPPGNQRDNHIGRLTACKGDFARWDATYGSYLTEETDCKEPGTVEAYELVGVYDNDFVSWDPSVAGLEIHYN
jgi:hypothetical protein